MCLNGQNHINVKLEWHLQPREREEKAEDLSDDTESTKQIPKIAIVTKANVNVKPKSKEAKN